MGLLDIAIAIGIAAVIAFFIVKGAVASDLAEKAKWDTYAVCKCGYRTYAPFGNLFHVHVEVCPQCGEDKDESMEVHTQRFINGAWQDKDDLKAEPLAEAA